MSNQESIIREKLKDYYSTIFETELIDEIVKVGHFETIKSCKLMIDIGEEITHIPLILDGIVKIIRQENDKELALYFLKKGDTCALSFINCINRKKSIFKGIVEQNMEAIFIPINLVDNWLVNYKSWRTYIIDSYHSRLIEMVESIDTLAFMKMEERIFKYLKDLVKITKDVNLNITHQEISDALNSSRVVITRLLKQLHDNGKIYSTRNNIRVLDL